MDLLLETESINDKISEYIYILKKEYVKSEEIDKISIHFSIDKYDKNTNLIKFKSIDDAEKYVLGSLLVFSNWKKAGNHLQITINHVSNNIAKITRRGPGNVIVYNPKIEQKIQQLKDACGPITTYEYISNSYINEDRILLFFRGNNGAEGILHWVDNEGLILHPDVGNYGYFIPLK